MPWTLEPSLSDPRSGLAAATCDAPSPAAGYRVYAVGGADANGPSTAVEAYDTSARAWSTVASLSTARTQLGATSTSGRLYALGGLGTSGPLGTHEIYDPAAKTWSSGPPLPTPRYGLAAVTGRDGRVYALGGSNCTTPGSNCAANTDLGTLEIFDPATNAWTTAPSPMPTPRSSFAAVTGPDGRIYAIGGNSAANGALTTVEIFDPATDSWSTGSSLPAPIWGLAAAVGPDGLIYAIGGLAAAGTPLSTVYSYDPATSGPWTVVSSSLLQPQGFLAADTGPDGLIYAIGGAFAGPLGTVEAFTVPTASVSAPDPYIGNGTYQTPDIILLDPSGNTVPIGGAPGGAWDTLLQPNTNYTLQAVIYNDSPVPALNTSVRFWHFPGSVGTAGAQISQQSVNVPANGSLLVQSANPFQSGSSGAHECAAVSVANPASPYFSVDPTTATEVIDPTVAHPPGSGHFGSAWRNTNSITTGIHGILRFPFQATTIRGIEPVPVKIAVTVSKVPADWERTEEVAKVRKTLQGAGSSLRLPLFLVPELRQNLPKADLDVKIQPLKADRPEGRSQRGGPNLIEHVLEELHMTEHSVTEHEITVPPEGAPFTVSATIPRDARKGDIFLLNVAAHYPAKGQVREAIVEYLEVIYVK